MNTGEMAAAALRAASGDKGAARELDAAGLSKAQRAELGQAANRLKGEIKRAAIKATTSKKK